MIAQKIPYRAVLGFALVATLAAVITVFATRDGTQAASFNPTASACLDDLSTVDANPLGPGNEGECDGDSSVGASTAVTTSLSILAPDSNFGGLVSFTPPDWGVALDADIVDGTQVAKLHSRATLGLINASCITSLQVSFDMLDATTNKSQQVIFDDQWDIVGGLARGVTEYPDYLTRILVEDEDDLSTTLQPIARYYGQTVVSGVDVSLNFVIFEPGIKLRGTQFAPQLGYPSVTVLQSIGDPAADPEPNAITDFCTPLLTSTSTFTNVRTNPAADGAYTFVTFSQSQRDADGDGIENSMDTCPYIPNPDWDPRDPTRPPPFGPGPAGDLDGDRIPDNCDPIPDDMGSPEGSFNDHDGDIYSNSQDNCPLAINSKGISHDGAKGPDNQKDSDSDGIGDACDENPNDADADGVQTQVCFAEVFTIGSGGTPTIDPDAIRTLQSYSPCGTDLGQAPGETPAPTAAPGNGGTATPGPGGTGGTGGTGGVGAGPDSGVGSLSPGASSLPVWATVLAAAAIAGLLGGIYILRTGPATDRRE